MKKMLTVMLIALVAMGMLFASGSKETATTSTKSEKGVITKPTTTTDPQLKKNIKILSIWAEDNDNGVLITSLLNKYIKEVNPNFSYEYEMVSSNDLKQKVTTLAASNDLPDIFVYESGKPILELVEADSIMDIGAIAEAFNFSNSFSPAAVSLLKTLSGTDVLYDLPLGMNVEGFWYNKALFEKAGAKVPQTWDEFEDALAKLQAAGIQPLAAGGADKWGLTRVVNAYLVRTAGPNAMKDASTGKAKYTDPIYVAAAQKIQDWANKGYFGRGITTVDMNTAGSMLMTGKAAIFYNGSWFAGNLNDKTANLAGEDGIGFFNVPVADASISDSTAYSMNCGNILCVGKSRYDEATGWALKYFVENIGNYAMSTQGTVKGYNYTTTNDSIPHYTQLVLDEIDKAKSAFTWFEATMGSEVSTVTQNNVQPLVTNDITAMEYMKKIQTAAELQNL